MCFSQRELNIIDIVFMKNALLLSRPGYCGILIFIFECNFISPEKSGKTSINYEVKVKVGGEYLENVGKRHQTYCRGWVCRFTV